MRHVKKLSGVIASLFAFCVLFVGVFSGVLVWRVSQGPVSLNRIAPYILDELNKSSGDLKFDVQDMVLVWRGWEEKFDVRMRRISVRQANGHEMLRMPAADVVFSSRALFKGILALREVDLIAPRMRLIRHSDGQFDIGLSGDLANVVPDDATDTGGDKQGADQTTARVPDMQEPTEPEDTAVMSTPIPDPAKSPAGETASGDQATPVTPDDQAASGDQAAPTVAENPVSAEAGSDAAASAPEGAAGENSEKADDPQQNAGDDGDLTEQELVSGSALMRRVVAILSGEAADFPAAAYFESFGIYHADLKVEDRLLGVTWSAPQSDIRLARRPGGIDADLKLAVAAGSMTTDVTATASYSTQDERIALKAHIDKVIPASLSTISSEFIGLDRFDLPVSGTFDANLGADGSIFDVVAQLDVGAGRVQLPTPLNSVYDIDGGKATVKYVPGKLAFRDVSVTTGKTGLKVNADIDHPLGNWAVQLKAAATNVATDDLTNLWPETLGDNPRQWVVKNLSGGGVHLAQIDLAMHRGENGDAAIDRLTGDMTMSDIDVQYLPGMPKVQKAAGHAEFNANSFSIFVDSGVADGIEVDSAKLVFSQLDTDNEWANIEFVVHGGVRDAMNLIDHEPLGFAKKLEIDPKQLSGSQATRVELSFPLLSDLSFDDVEVAAASRIEKAKITNVFRKLDLNNGNFELQVNTKGLELSGDATIGQGHNTIRWVESFDDKTPLTSHYQLGGKFDLAALNDIGIDVSSFLKGTADGDVEIKVIRAGGVEVIGKADLANSEIDLSEADYHKDAQQPSKLAFDVLFGADGGGTVRKIDLTAPDAAILASGRWRGENKLDDKVHFQLANGHFRENSGLTGTLVVNDNDVLKIDVTGDQIDLRPFLTENGGAREPGKDGAGDATGNLSANGSRNDKGATDSEFSAINVRLEANRFYVKGDAPVVENGRITFNRKKADSEIDVKAERFDARPWLISSDASSDSKGDDQQGTPAAGTGTKTGKGPDSGGIGEETTRVGGKKEIYLDFGELVAARDQVVKNLKGSIHVEGQEWRSIVLNGKLDGTADLFAQVEPVAGGKRKVQLSSDDAGRFLAAIDLYGDLRGGKLNVQGTVDDRTYSQPFTGTAHIENFRIVNAPLGARVLNAASLLGLVDSLQGKGISFDAMDGDFTYANNVLTLSKVAANGAAIGVTANGSIDLAQDQIKLAGSVVPFYALNSVLGKIPLIGDLLVGEEGGGVFAPTYTVEGPVENPDISVNPLSTFVPGVFRNLITGAKPG
ncbi:AsmA-like C-terminal domain-containing protein [Thalassospira marina]|uniref:YhdP family protein n=1 Tax=Thalassospira marina TaxID=2048283 RepID=UPI0012FEB0B9|nr:AsmA-like C-terminal domain-containing protein [Thalassospira marina]